MKVAGIFLVMNEIWKDIKGYEGLFQASSLGRIRSLDREDYYPATKKRKFIAGRILSGRYIYLNVGGRQSKYTAHQLVAAAFFDVYQLGDDGVQVRHVCGVSDNRPENLEIYTATQAISYGGEVRKRYKGVKFDKKSGRYAAVVRVCGKDVGLGMYDTAEDAFLAYSEAERLHKEENEQYRKDRKRIAQQASQTKKRRADKWVKRREIYDVIKKIRETSLK